MSILSWLLDLLYPPKCIVCGKPVDKAAYAAHTM